MKKPHPALVLYFLSPAVGELLSSSSPPAEFFSPLGLTLMCLLYGGGAIIVRELTHRWGKGWPTIFVLGAAYGIVEEGLLCKSFFDPNWKDLGDLANYGRAISVNWVWSLNLTFYHAFISISVPILLVEMIYPSQQKISWVTRRVFNVIAILFSAIVLFGFFVLKGADYPKAFIPPIPHTIITLILVMLLYILAKRLPKSYSSMHETTAPYPFWMLPIGAILTASLYLIPAGMIHTGSSFIVCMAGTALWAGLVIWMISKWANGNKAWPRKHRPIIIAFLYAELAFVLLLCIALFLGKMKQPLLIAPILAGAVYASIKIPQLTKGTVPWSEKHALGLAFGALIPFMIAAVGFEFANHIRPDNTAGMSLVGIGSAIGLSLLWYRTHKRIKSKSHIIS